MSADVGTMYRVHAARVWRYVRARLPSDADAEDVTSDVFMRAIRSHDRFDASRGTEGAWITGIARHAVADWWRRRRPEDPTDDVPNARADTSDGPEAAAERAAESAGVLDHLEHLTDRERDAIAMRFGAELSSAEIGAAMDISPTAARMLVHRGVARLREVMADDR